LEKGAQVLTNDYRPHFFLWYNYFSYLNDPEKAGEHLQKAARIPGSPPYFSTLAARMDLYAGKIYAAVIFLEETLKETSDPAMRHFLSMRLEAMKRIGFLEYKIQDYRKRFLKNPQTLQDLVDSGVITKIPTDPYGGEFYIMENGRVYTTSKLVAPKP
jgi:tetratricopeptide (TPR) repeat protein